MGKVKRRTESKYYRQAFVSIPYGKGKAKEYTIIEAMAVLYQFPMGKVKTIHVKCRPGKAVFVSIPYGKGKGIISNLFFVSMIRINSLWER